ncbi:hypothetical protein [Stackebrandtia soli]|uniref:aa3-type cytochrome oxidase subunit CtaJ n=1 Tax=Stackebrandtia soli TaxID=1892856 RepID=UPI0039ED5538
MTVLDTVLIFVGIPAVVIAVVVGLVYGSSRRQAKRYRPGRDFEVAPVWFLARPEDVSVAGAADYVAESEQAQSKAIEGTSKLRTGIKGGASANW